MIRSRSFDFGVGGEQRQAEFEKQRTKAQEYMDKKVSQWEKKYARAIVEGEMPDLTEDILEQIDFQALHEILGEYMGRSGVDPETFNLLEKSDIRPVQGFRSYGLYESQINKIFVDLNFFRSEPDRALILPQIIIHELVHAASGFLYKNHGSAATDHMRTGYQHGEIKPGSDFQYSAFDEAVTEKIAQEIMEVYAQRTGTTQQLQKLKAVMSEKKKFFSYAPQVEFLNSMIDKISDACEVPPGTVWDAIKKGKFGNDELNDPEVERALTEIFNVKFVDRLKRGKLEDMVESQMLRIKMKLQKFLSFI